MKPKTRYALRRIVLTIPVLAAMSVAVFSIVHLVPGDPAGAMLGLHATPAALARIRADLHLNESLPAQYLHWIANVLRGNLGSDYVSGEAVSSELGVTLPVTAELAVGSLLVGVAIGLIAGASGARRGLLRRRLSSAFVVAGVAIPDFWLAIMLVLAFAATLAWLPPEGYEPLTSHPLENLRYFTLPVMALGLSQAAYFARTVRATLEDALDSPWARFLRAKGVPERSIVWRHALRNAAAPIVTVIGVQFGALLGGAIIIETIFTLPGTGRLLYQAILQRDYTVVQGCVLVVTTMFVMVNVATDLLVAWIDPRVGDGLA